MVRIVVIVHNSGFVRVVENGCQCLDLTLGFVFVNWFRMVDVEEYTAGRWHKISFRVGRVVEPGTVLVVDGALSSTAT